jgi:hypothetical protein
MLHAQSVRRDVAISQATLWPDMSSLFEELVSLTLRSGLFFSTANKTLGPLNSIVLFEQRTCSPTTMWPQVISKNLEI